MACLVTRGVDATRETEGTYATGKRQGTCILFHEACDDNVVREVGPYGNGEFYGTWTPYDASGNVVGTLRYENGRRIEELTIDLGNE